MPDFMEGTSVDISIHALREEGDPGVRHGCALDVGISIHALREEGDLLPFFRWCGQ